MADSEGKSYQWDVNRVEAVFAELPNARYVLVENMDVGALKAYAKKRKIDLTGVTEKKELRERVEYAKHEECGICMGEFREGQWVKTTWCGHQFHWACLGEAMLQKASTATKPRTGPVTCPYCATDLKKPLPPAKAGSKRPLPPDDRDNPFMEHFFKNLQENMRERNRRRE